MSRVIEECDPEGAGINVELEEARPQIIGGLVLMFSEPAFLEIG
jgi:hypothetical protein